VLSARNKRGNQTRALQAAAELPIHGDDLRLALKREFALRELSIADVAKRLPIDVSYLQNSLSNNVDKQRRLPPSLLERIIAAVHITPRVARRLHALAARDDGWKVEVPHA
jgi:hypothetical protein